LTYVEGVEAGTGNPGDLSTGLGVEHDAVLLDQRVLLDQTIHITSGDQIANLNTGQK
jgi:hypothetical protein